MGQERLGPSYFFTQLVLGPLNSLVWYVPSLRYTRGLGWRMHCGVEVTESSTNKQQHLLIKLRIAKIGILRVVSASQVLSLRKGLFAMAHQADLAHSSATCSSAYSSGGPRPNLPNPKFDHHDHNPKFDHHDHIRCFVIYSA